MLPLGLIGPQDGPTHPAAVLLLAVIQGVAEFLPISSSGHLVLGRAALGIREAGLALDVSLHVGTLVAVVIAYRREVRALFADLFGGRWHMIAWLVLATIPVGISGVLGKPLIERAAQSTSAAAGGLFFTACVLLLGDWARRRHHSDEPDSGSYGVPAFSLALWIGLAQALAPWPGISRSGTTIAAGLLLGLPVLQAARLSFLMSLPAVLGAALFELPEAVESGIGGLSSGLVLAAIAVAALVGWASLRVLLVVTARGAFPWFAGYCVLIGGLALVLL